MQLSSSEKSPVVATLSTVTGLVAVLVKVSCWGELDLPMVWVLKLIEEGDVVSMGCWTVTGIEIWRFCDPKV